MRVDKQDVDHLLLWDCYVILVPTLNSANFSRSCLQYWLRLGPYFLRLCSQFWIVMSHVKTLYRITLLETFSTS